MKGAKSLINDFSPVKTVKNARFPHCEEAELALCHAKPEAITPPQ